MRILIRLGLTLGGNALGLWIASLLLDKVSISGGAFIIAVVIFTVLEAVLLPFIAKTTEDNAPILHSLSALITTFAALLITVLVSDGLSVDGTLTWVLATVIVWLATMIAGVVLTKLLLPEKATVNIGR